MKHYLSDDEKWDVTFDTFQPDEMKDLIIKHLTENKEATVVHRKDFAPNLQKKYYGQEVINFYENNPKTGVPSKVIIKGDKTFYQSLLK